MPASARIMKEWQSFAKAVMPADVHPIQYNEMRRAFFGGARAMMTLMVNASDGTEEAGAAILTELDGELGEFSQGFAGGKF